jgi:hypothetical protein
MARRTTDVALGDLGEQRRPGDLRATEVEELHFARSVVEVEAPFAGAAIDASRLAPDRVEIGAALLNPPAPSSCDLVGVACSPGYVLAAIRAVGAAAGDLAIADGAPLHGLGRVALKKRRLGGELRGLVAGFLLGAATARAILAVSDAARGRFGAPRFEVIAALGADAIVRRS